MVRTSSTLFQQLQQHHTHCARGNRTFYLLWGIGRIIIRMKRLLIKEAKQNCPVALSVLGELAIADIVYPTTTSSLTFKDGVKKARTFYKQVYHITEGKNNEVELEQHAQAAYVLGVLDFVQTTSLKLTPTIMLPSENRNGEDDAELRRHEHYEHGKTLRNTTRNDKHIRYSNGFEYFQHAASLDQGDAIFLLGYFYHVGCQLYDISVDPKRAKKLFERACQLGHNGARLYVAQRYRFGDKPLSIQPSIKVALRYFQPALNEKDSWAMFMAGDDAGGITTKYSFVQMPTGGVFPNVAMSWYSRCLPNALQNNFYRGRRETKTEKVEGGVNNISGITNNKDSSKSPLKGGTNNKDSSKSPLKGENNDHHMTRGTVSGDDLMELEYAMDTNRLSTSTTPRLYLFDDMEWRYKHEDLVEPNNMSNNSASIRINDRSPPLIYGCGRRLLHQMLAGDTIGQARAILRAGIHLYNGFGIEKDIEKAKEVWKYGLELDPWNTILMDAVRLTGNTGDVARAMSVRQHFVVKDAAERPFPEHWGYEDRTPFVIKSEDDLVCFLQNTNERVSDVIDKEGNTVINSDGKKRDAYRYTARGYGTDHGGQNLVNYDNKNTVINSGGGDNNNKYLNCNICYKKDRDDIEEKPKVGFILCTTGWASMAWIEEHSVHDRQGAALLKRRFETFVIEESKKKTQTNTHPCIFGAVDLSNFPTFLEKQGYTIDQCPTIIVVFNGQIHSQYSGLPDEQFDIFYRKMKQEAPEINDMCGLVRRTSSLGDKL